MVTISWLWPFKNGFDVVHETDDGQLWSLKFQRCRQCRHCKKGFQHFHYGSRRRNLLSELISGLPVACLASTMLNWQKILFFFLNIFCSRSPAIRKVYTALVFAWLSLVFGTFCELRIFCYGTDPGDAENITRLRWQETWDFITVIMWYIVSICMWSTFVITVVFAASVSRVQ